jgi:hypothetical protein
MRDGARHVASDPVSDPRDDSGEDEYLPNDTLIVIFLIN